MQREVWQSRAASGALLVLACGKQRSTSINEKPTPSANVSSVASASPSARVSDAPLDEQRVRALIEKWLAAQNKGDFKGYEELYAPRFVGIKRSGSYTARFDRSGWLRDRAGMFARPMQVTASAIKVALAPSLGRVTLEQTWSSGSYRDVGPKELIVVSAPEGPRIAREEMLSSKVSGAEGRTVIEQLMLVGKPGLLLRKLSDESWARGDVKPGPTENIALRDVDESALPAELRSLKGRSVHVLDAKGALCDSKIVSFELYAEVIPHFGMVQTFHGENGEPALTRAQIAKQIWTLADGSTLVGKLSPACAGLWALDADRASPTAAAPEPATPDVKAKALRAFKALPDYAKIQDEFQLTAQDPKGPWENYAGAAPQVLAFNVASKLTLVSVYAQSGSGCGDFGRSLSALFSVRKGTAQELELQGVPDVPSSPTSVFDLDGDGSPEVLFGSARTSDDVFLWRKSASGPSLTHLFNIPNLDCGC